MFVAPRNLANVDLFYITKAEVNFQKMLNCMRHPVCRFRVGYRATGIQRPRNQSVGSWGLSVDEWGTYPRSVSIGVLYPSRREFGYMTPMDTEHGQVPHALINPKCPWWTKVHANGSHLGHPCSTIVATDITYYINYHSYCYHYHYCNQLSYNYYYIT